MSDYIPAIKAGIEEHTAEIDAITANTEAPTFENTIAAGDRSGAILKRVSSVLFNVSESDYSPELNAIVEKDSWRSQVAFRSMPSFPAFPV